MAAAQEASTAAPHSNANHEREPRTIHEDSSEVETIAEPSRETTPEVDQHHDDEKDVKDIGKVPAAAGASAEAKTDANKKDETYSIYGKANKAWLVSIITVLGFLSPLTANMYAGFFARVSKY